VTTRKSKADTAANRRLAELVRGEFEKSPMNRAELAERSGVPAGTLAGIMNGTKPIYAEQLALLSEALGVPPEKWIKEMLAARQVAEEINRVEPETDGDS